MGRSLSPTELVEAQLVFDASLDYRRVRITEGSRFALAVGYLGSLFDRGGQRPTANAMTVGYSVRFSRELRTSMSQPEQTRIGDMAWLIHELTHAWQYEHSGWIYLPQAMSERVLQGSKAYQYSSKSGLVDRGRDLQKQWQDGKRFRKFRREQQGNVVRDYYVALKTNEDTSGWEPFITELRNAAGDSL